jgi:hypothetical protein
MKNIHILPSRFPKGIHLLDYHITSDEEIKEGEYGIDIRDSKVFKCERTLSNHYEFGVLQFQKSYCKKIILTTDQDLIADGVQAIDDEFLEWFVQNPSCEKIEVNKSYSGIYYIKYPYKIIIPQEEPKQDEIDFMANELVIEKEKFESKETLEQETCNFCGKTLREQMKGCGEITCYRQFLPKQETLEDFCTRELSNFNDNVRNTQFDLGFRTGAIIGLRFPKERSYNE